METSQVATLLLKSVTSYVIVDVVVSTTDGLYPSGETVNDLTPPELSVGVGGVKSAEVSFDTTI